MAMIPNIQSPKSGEPIPAKWGQDTARAINSIAQQLVQYPMSRDDDGEALNLQIARSSTIGYYVVTTGTVNTEVPTLGATALNAATAPTFTVTADTYVWLKCVGTFGSPDTYVVTVETSTTDEVPAGTAITATTFTSFFYIGWVDFTAGSPATYAITNVHGGGNLGVDSWGLYNLWWRA